MNNFNKLRLLVFIRFLGEAFFFPFISLYLSRIGLTTYQIGICIAVIPITSLLCAPIYSIICKTPKQAKITLTIMTFVEPLFIVLLLLTKQFSISLISLIFIGIFSSSNYGLFESLMALTCRQKGKTFASIRLFGSVSYTLGVLSSSLIIKFCGYTILFFIAVGLFICSGILYLFLKAPENEQKGEKPSFKEIFSNKFFIGYLLFYILLIGSMQVADDFFSLYLQSKGSPDYIYSFVMVGFVCVEILVMFTYKFWYKKLGISSFFIASGCLVLRLAIQMIPTANIPMLIAAQMLRGIVWGISLSMNSIFVVILLGFDKSTRGIVLVTFGLGIFTSIFKLCGGYIIDYIGYPRFYGILWIISIISFIYFLIYFLLYKKRRSQSTI